MPLVVPALPGPPLDTLPPAAHTPAVWRVCFETYTYLRRLDDEHHRLLQYARGGASPQWSDLGAAYVRALDTTVPAAFREDVLTYLHTAVVAATTAGRSDYGFVGEAMQTLLTPALAQAEALGAHAIRTDLEAWLLGLHLPDDGRQADAVMTFTQTLLLAAVPTGQWTGADLLRVFPRLSYRPTLLSHLTALIADSENWAARPVVVRYLDDILALPRPARPKAVQSIYDRVRRAMTDVLVRQERYPEDSPAGAANARMAATLLGTYLRDTAASTEPLTPAELSAIPWAQDRRTGTPTVAEARPTLARLAVPAYRTRMSTRDLAPPLRVLRAVAGTPRTAHLMVSDVWSRATTPAARATLLFHGGLLARDGPWWFDATWRQEAFETLSTLPDTFAPPPLTPALRGLFTLTVGHVSADLWFRAAWRWAVVSKAHPEFLRDILDVAGTHPTWRPTPEAVLPFLQHPEASIRALAQCALPYTVSPAVPPVEGDRVLGDQPPTSRPPIVSGRT